MFWSDIRQAFRGLSLNAGLIQYFIEDLEESECEDSERVERITKNIEREIFDRLMRLRGVPPLSELFIKHYEDPAGEGQQRVQRSNNVSHM